MKIDHDKDGFECSKPKEWGKMYGYSRFGESWPL